MSIQELSLNQSMSKNLKARISHDEDKLMFEKALNNFIENLDLKTYESEEFQKNLLKDFLQQCLPQNFINTSERTDLVIYNGHSPESTAGILIETKSLSNENEMISTMQYNTKAFHEIIHYYLNERLVNNNIEIKKSIITNGIEWFIIEAKEIEKHFIKNKELINLYKKWRSAQLSDITTDFLYKQVIAPAINKSIENNLKITHFNLRKEIKKNNITKLYKFFTPENLLNKNIIMDSNKLNYKFYDELLYLMGLQETKIDNQKVIQRLPVNKRQKGSLVENIISRLKTNEVSKGNEYEVAIQLSVIWINRILFLKLLESQLITFNDDSNYRFLTKKLLPSFDDIYDLFFGVLAKRMNQRSDEMKEKFPQVPYLNSSLFEKTELESRILGIDQLRDRHVQFHSKTVLKDSNGKQRKGDVEFLTYLFDFLNAYDFSTSIDHNKENKNNLINAAVLGLIFEKINGYKDGSYYTSSKITMYMSRNVIRKAVVEKVNKAKGWQCDNIYDLQFKITSLDEAKDINEIMDTLKICDPAVGSGHFLVSVLNEIITIKSELNILIDEDGYSMNDIRCYVVNDELIIKDINGNNFIYKRGNLRSEHIQRTIFHEKRKIIENCLFGVDINSNSVNICHLRLWIELLKSSYYYYDEKSGIQELITLPNIDINIKTGNSLIHKFDINSGLDHRFTDLNTYIHTVTEYKKTNNKQKKQNLIKQINEIKQRFSSYIETPELKRVVNLRKQLLNYGQIDLFASNEDIKKQSEDISNIRKKLKKAYNKLESSQKNPFFRGGLEWRMEFPEVLDNAGGFIGFDVVITNPPYIYSSNNAFSDSEKQYFKHKYPLSTYQVNTYGLFLELCFKILNENGYASLILPNTFLTIGQYDPIRRFILENKGNAFFMNSYEDLFDDPAVDNCIVSFKNSSPDTVVLAELDDEVKIVNEVTPDQLLNFDVINISAFRSIDSIDAATILRKIEMNSSEIEGNYATLRVGLEAYERGKGNPKQPTDNDEFERMKNNRVFFSDRREQSDYRMFLFGEDVNRYEINWSGKYLKYGKHLAAPRDPKLFKGQRILIRRIPATSEYAIVAAFTNDEYVNEQSLTNCFNLKANPKFLLGVLNSKTISYWALNKFDLLQRRKLPQMRAYQMKKFPIPNVSEEEQRKLISLVERLMDLHSLNNSTNENLKEMDEINTLIDEFVMDLFKLDSEQQQVIRNFTIS